MIMSKVDLSIIIVSHNHSKYLSKNIKSIIRNTVNINYEIVLVNNLKKDEGILNIVEKYPQIKYVENQFVKGFSANNNMGIKKSSGEYIAILNPDTYLLNNAFEIILGYMKKNKRIGVCGPKILNPDGSLQYSCRKFPSFKSFLYRRTPLRIFFNQNEINKDHLMINFDRVKPSKVDWMLGACLIIKRKQLEKIGMLDENFFMYCEDIDICYTMKNKSLDRVYVPEAEICHFHQAQTDKKFFSKLTLYHFKSMAYFIIKHKYIKSLFS